MAIAAREESQKFDLQLPLRREIHMSALAGENLMLAAVPEQSRFPQARSRRDDRLIPNRGRNSIQRKQILRGERANTPRTCFQIIDQESGGQLNLFRQAGLFNDPGKVRGLDPSIVYRAGNSKTRNLGPGDSASQELGDNLTQFAVFAAGKDSLGNHPEMAVLWLKIGQSSVGSSNIAGQDHFSKFLQWRPSRSSSSSASFGPQVPEA